MRKQYENIFYTVEQDKGLLLDWSDFRNGDFKISEGDGETIMLLGGASFLYKYLSEKYDNLQVKVVRPKTTFQIEFLFDGRSISVYRQIMGEKLWLDPHSYNYPDSYYLIYGFNQNDGQNYNQELSELFNYYEQRSMQITKEFDKTTKIEIQEIDEQLKDVDYAILNVYRYPGKGFLVGYNLYLGDSLLCRVKSNFKATFKLEKEGETVLWAKTEGKEEIPIEIKFGKEYYLNCGLRTGVMVGRPFLKLVGQNVGREEFESLKTSKD